MHRSTPQAALALINKLKEHNLTKTTKLKEVKHDRVINHGDFAIEFIKTNHSIRMHLLAYLFSCGNRGTHR